MAEKEINQNVKFVATPVPEQNIGIETKKSIVNKLKDDEGLSSQMDSSTLAPFRDISTNREKLYDYFDEMAQDVIISSALDLYADDSTEYDDEGKIIWAESDDAECAKSVNYLIDSLKLNENAWLHVRSLVHYGDVYLQTFRQSDIDEDSTSNRNRLEANRNVLKESAKPKQGKKKDPYLLEDVIVNYYSENDRLQDYIEMYPNPAEIFDLVKRGKTHGFLRTITTDEKSKTASVFSNYNFGLLSNDIKIYDATKFVHISLPDAANRHPEKVQLFRGNVNSNSKEKEVDALSYNVKKGKSILYDVYKIYRELKLLEDSLLLSRLTKSSILRVVQVEVGEMGKAAVQQVLQRVKTLMEQKSSMTEGSELGNYLNPSAIENNIYVPTRGGKGEITTNTIGGDYESGQLTDLDYWNNKLFGGLKIPKPYLGFMDDNAGFSGGESLTKASSRYAKTIKRVKNAYIQGITTLINIFLIDRGLQSYVNKFAIKMVSPTTTDDTERMEQIQNKTQLIGDIMNTLSDIEDSKDRLKLAKILINKYIPDEDVEELLEEIINKEEPTETTPQDNLDKDIDDVDVSDFTGGSSSPQNFNDNAFPEDDTDANATGEEEDEERLPNPTELDVDLSDTEATDMEIGGEE